MLEWITAVNGKVNGFVWGAFSDTLNGMMAIPNLIALLVLSGVAAGITRDYFGARKAG